MNHRVTIRDSDGELTLPLNATDPNSDPTLLRHSEPGYTSCGVRNPVKGSIFLLLLMVLMTSGRGQSSSRRQGERFGLRVISVDTEAVARELRARAQAGETFEELALTYSNDPSREAGGFIGIVTLPELNPDYRAAVTDLPIGEVSPVTRVGEEYVLLQRLSLEEGLWMEQTSLALDAFNQGRVEEAEEGLTHALESSEALGPLNVYTSLSYLADLYLSQQDYSAAEPLYRRALDLAQGALGAGHPGLTPTLNSLALIYKEQGNFARANEMLEQAQQIFVDAFGPNDPSVAMGLRNIARLRRVEGNPERAESLYQVALSILEQALGPDDPSIAETLDELAGLLEERGRVNDAAPLTRRAESIRRAQAN